MSLCDVEPWPRAPRRRPMATEVAPLKAGVYCGAAVELVIAGFSRFEAARNTRRVAVKVPLGCGSVGVVERVDWKRSRLAAQAECSCWPCHAQLDATAQSCFRSSQAPLIGFIVVCREKWGCTFSSSLTSSLCFTAEHWPGEAPTRCWFQLFISLHVSLP